MGELYAKSDSRITFPEEKRIWGMYNSGLVIYLLFSGGLGLKGRAFAQTVLGPITHLTIQGWIFKTLSFCFQRKEHRKILLFIWKSLKQLVLHQESQVCLAVALWRHSTKKLAHTDNCFSGGFLAPRNLLFAVMEILQREEKFLLLWAILTT